jgi:PAS domain S-box-containing protein
VDQTDTKRIEKQLHEALDNWHSLVHNAPDVIMTVDRGGKIAFVNRPVWGCSTRALSGTRLVDYVGSRNRSKLQSCIERAFNSSERSTCEVTGVNGDGASWYSFTFGPVQQGTHRNEQKTTTVMIREVSEHKRTEAALRASGEQLRQFAARIEAVREEERTRVARELHDELGQALTILKLDLSWLRTKTPREENERRKKMKSMIDHVDQTIERVRDIVSELRPSILDDLGLIAALEWQLSQFQKRTGIRTVFESSIEQIDVSPDASAAVFRVVQEALTNVVRHAKASRVRVSMKSSAGVLKVSIEDNGKGITKAQVNDLRSLGIVGMTERVHRIQGELTISSSPRQGTRLDIVISTPPKKRK